MVKISQPALSDSLVHPQTTLADDLSGRVLVACEVPRGVQHESNQSINQSINVRDSPIKAQSAGSSTHPLGRLLPDNAF